MKEFFTKIWNGIKTMFKNLWEMLKDWKNLVIFIIVTVILYIPTWLLGILGFVFDNAAFISIAIGYAAFWAGPFTPFWLTVIGITIGIRKIIDRICKK